MNFVVKAMKIDHRNEYIIDRRFNLQIISLNECHDTSNAFLCIFSSINLFQCNRSLEAKKPASFNLATELKYLKSFFFFIYLLYFYFILFYFAHFSPKPKFI